jgi:hypothetical protein
VQVDTVTNRNVGSHYAGLRVCNVHNATILQVATSTYFNVIDIAAHDRIVPNRGVYTKAHIAYYTCTRSDKNTVRYGRGGNAYV